MHKVKQNYIEGSVNNAKLDCLGHREGCCELKVSSYEIKV